MSRTPVAGAGDLGPATGTHHCRVEWADTDAAGIYHNSAVIRYVEAAEANLVRALGLDGYFPSAPRVHYEVSFERPLRFGQEVVATVRVERLGRTSLTFGFEVWGGDGAGRASFRAAHGSYVTVHLGDARAGSPPADRAGTAVAWPQDWVAALGARGGAGPAE